MNDKPVLTSGMFTSRTEEWATPQYVFDELNREFHFTLDVCATQENAKCARYFTKTDDALGIGWQPRVDLDRHVCWMNPPYGRDIQKWMQKAYEESCKGAVVVCLVHARTDTRWWHDWAMKATEIRFIKGRLKFGNGKQSAPFPSCVIIFKRHGDVYAEPKFTTQRFYQIATVKSQEGEQG